jgi:hypothetical protein
MSIARVGPDSAVGISQNTTKYTPCMISKVSLLCTQKPKIWELLDFRSSVAEVLILRGYGAMLQANCFPKLRKIIVVSLQAWTFPPLSTSSLLCLEKWGISYSVTWCHIIEEQIPYQYLRHFNPVQNLATAVLQMQTQKDERKVIQNLLNYFNRFSAASNTHDVFPRTVIYLKFIQPLAVRSD